MSVRTYQENRENFPVEELRKHDGKWVAFSGDGSRIVASADDLEAVHELVLAAGEDPQRVGLERIDDEIRVGETVDDRTVAAPMGRLRGGVARLPAACPGWRKPPVCRGRRLPADAGNGSAAANAPTNRLTRNVSAHRGPGVRS